MEKSEKDLRDRESSILQRDTLQNQRKLSRDERRERRDMLEARWREESAGSVSEESHESA